MKQITEIDDPRLVKALAHPLRINIMRVLTDRVASPSDLATELGAPLGNVSYHVRYLERVRIIELVETRPRRGALEHYYRAIGRLRITDRAWNQVPGIVKDALLEASLIQIIHVVRAAAAAGGFDRRDAHLSRQPMVLDERGFRELAAEAKKLLDRAGEIEAASARRLAEDDHAGAQVNAGLALMLFEAAPVLESVGQDHGGEHGRQASARRSLTLTDH